jgi:hypothetical protein
MNREQSRKKKAKRLQEFLQSKNLLTRTGLSFSPTGDHHWIAVSLNIRLHSLSLISFGFFLPKIRADFNMKKLRNWKNFMWLWVQSPVRNKKKYTESAIRYTPPVVLSSWVLPRSSDPDPDSSTVCMLSVFYIPLPSFQVTSAPQHTSRTSSNISFTIYTISSRWSCLCCAVPVLEAHKSHHTVEKDQWESWAGQGRGGMTWAVVWLHRTATIIIDSSRWGKEEDGTAPPECKEVHRMYAER